MRTVGSLLLLTVLLTAPVHAQRTSLDVTGFPVVFAAPTPANLDAGVLTSATATSFTVEVSGGPAVPRLAVVSIRCQAPCPATGSKSMVSLQWRRADQSLWQPLTTADVPIESRVMQRNLPLPQSNNPWSNALYWQTQVGWTSDPPGSHTFNIVMTLTVTAL